MANSNRENIIETSRALFLEQGYNNTSLRQIADRCGIQLGSLYYYFKKKEELIFFFNEELYVRFTERLKNRYNGLLDNLEGFVAVEYIFLFSFATDEKYRRVFVEASTINSLNEQYIKLHHEMFLLFLQKKDVNVGAREIFSASTVAGAAEIQAMRYYDRNYSHVDFEEVFIDSLRVRLILVLKNYEEAEHYIKIGIKIAKTILSEGVEKMDIADVGT